MSGEEVRRSKEWFEDNQTIAYSAFYSHLDMQGFDGVED